MENSKHERDSDVGILACNDWVMYMIMHSVSRMTLAGKFFC